MFHLTLGLLAAGDPAELGDIVASPFGTVLLSGMALRILSSACIFVGRAFGARAADWRGGPRQLLQAIFLILQAVQVLFMLTVPLLADVIGYARAGAVLLAARPFVYRTARVPFGLERALRHHRSAFAIALVLSLLLVTLAGA